MTRILIADDEDSMRLLVSRAVAMDGHATVTAVDGAEALEILTRERGAFDLLLTDIQMPVMDGIAATKAIRALPAPFGSAPIVATTANVLAHQIKAYRDSGMNGCVAKPISPAALLNELARLANDEGLASEPEVLSA